MHEALQGDGQCHLAGTVEDGRGNARELIEGIGHQAGDHVALAVPYLLDEPPERAGEIAFGRTCVDRSQDLADLVQIVAGDGAHRVPPLPHCGQRVEIALPPVRRPDLRGRTQPFVDPRLVPPGHEDGTDGRGQRDPLREVEHPEVVALELGGARLPDDNDRTIQDGGEDDVEAQVLRHHLDRSPGNGHRPVLREAASPSGMIAGPKLYSRSGLRVTRPPSTRVAKIDARWPWPGRAGGRAPRA